MSDNKSIRIGISDKAPMKKYIPTKKAIVIALDRTDSIDCTLNGLPLSEENNLHWEIADTSIARIDENRIISAVKKGETTVNAIINNEVVVSVPVIVERQPLPPLNEINPSRFTLNSDGFFIDNSSKKTNKATLMFVGDLMFLSEQQRNARTPDGSYDFNPSFKYVKSLLEQADFSMGTLETIVDPAHPYKCEQTKIDNGTGYMAPNCNAPVTCLDAVRFAGIDAVSTANNHCMDSGINGLITTKKHLDRYNIIHTGTFTENEQRYLLVDLNGIKIAILAYTTSLNLMENLWNLTPHERSIYTNQYIQGVSENIVKNELEEVKKLGVDFVFVMLHAGVVNTLEPVKKVVEVCRELANAGADYVINTHSHTLQSYNIITTKDARKVPVIYSMGNFVSSMDQVEDQRNRDAIILTIELEKINDKIFVDDGYIPCFSRRNFKDDKFVTLPCDKAYNGNNQNGAMIEAKKRIKQTLGEEISKVSTKTYKPYINND